MKLSKKFIGALTVMAVIPLVGCGSSTPSNSDNVTSSDSSQNSIIETPIDTPQETPSATEPKTTSFFSFFLYMFKINKFRFSLYRRTFHTHSSIDCFVLQTLSDEAAKVMYQMKRASSVNNNNNSNTAEIPKKPRRRKKKVLVEGM